MARYQSQFRRRESRSLLAPERSSSDDRMDQLAQDGVSCSLCHQISKDKLGTRESLVGGFVVDTVKNAGEREEYGPFKIEDGQNRIMRTSSGGYRRPKASTSGKSELCATCHTLITKALGPDGQKIGSASRADAVSGMARQRVSRTSRAARTATCRSSKELVRVTNTLGQYPRGRCRGTRFRRRQLFHAANAEQVSRRSRRDRASRGVRGGGDSHHRASEGKDGAGFHRSPRHDWRIVCRPTSRCRI